MRLVSGLILACGLGWCLGAMGVLALAQDGQAEADYVKVGEFACPELPNLLMGLRGGYEAQRELIRRRLCSRVEDELPARKIERVLYGVWKVEVTVVTTKGIVFVGPRAIGTRLEPNHE